MFARGTICDHRELTTGKYGRRLAAQAVAVYAVLYDVTTYS